MLCKQLNFRSFMLWRNIYKYQNSANFYHSCTLAKIPLLCLCLKNSCIQSTFTAFQRYYSKGKSKGGGGKQAHSHISESELAEMFDVDGFREDGERAIENLKRDFLQNLSLRTNLASLESIRVKFEGSSYLLSEIAQVIHKSPSMVMVNCSSLPQATSNVKNAIIDAGMNLNPQQDGTSLFIPIPKVTKEHREGLVQKSKVLCERTKVNLRDVQTRYLKKLKQKDGTFPKDLMFNAQLKVREMTQNYCNTADALMKEKQNELLKPSK